jgi:fatty acid desaturase
MALEILRDPRLEAVEWQDLCRLGPLEVVYEVGIYLPWLVVSCLFAQLATTGTGASWQLAWFLPALASSFMFFLCGLRQVHNAFHYAVGVSPRAHEWLMFVLSPLMMSAMHAVQWNHLRHHRHCMDDDDVEAFSARMPGWKALLTGPQFPVRLHHAALTLAKPRIRRWIHAELAAIAAIAVLAFFVLDLAWLRYHVIAMTVGQCFSAFFAVWTVHHDCDRTHFIARTLRNEVKSLVSYNMFYHVEHHLFPAVPTCHLPELSKRLDAVAPELRSKNVW